MSRAAGQPASDQIKIIWTLGRKLKLQEPDIRAILLRETGKESMRECDDQELKRVILAMRQLEGEENATGNRATKRQAWMIRQLAEQMGWHHDPQRLQGFLKKNYKVEQPEWLTRAQAWRAVEGLKKIAAKAAK